MDYELPVLYNFYYRKARKNHICSECGGVIKKGEKYECHEGLWEFEWQTFKRCDDCCRLINHLECMYKDSEKVPFSGLYEYIGEMQIEEIELAFINICLARGSKYYQNYIDNYIRSFHRELL